MRGITRTKFPLVKNALYGRCQIAFYSSYADSVPKHTQPNRFAVPTLSQSIEKYLRYVEPLIPPEQWCRTCKVASAYVSSPAVCQLQKALEKKTKLEDNWLFDWWLSSYLTYRAPVVVHSNPGVRIKTMCFSTDREWLTHAAKIAYGAIEFKRRLESKSLPTEYLPDGSPLCMSQHYSFLGNCRIPGLPHDRMLFRRGGPHTTHAVGHLCVFFRNRIYRLNFLDPVTGEVAPLGLIIGQLEHIVSTGRNLPPGPFAGLLTTAQRDDWSRAHAMLRQHVPNANTLTDIEHSLIVLCLDESADLPDGDSKPSADDNARSSTAFNPRDHASNLNCLHGNLVNSGNRWFDKSLQFIVSRDGSVGLNFEHTPGDGGAIVSILSDIYDVLDDQLQAAEPVPRVPRFAHPQELPLLLSKPLVGAVEQAGDALKKLVDDVDVYSITFNSFGANAIKELKLSPDSFFQLALQLAYSRLHPDQLPPATYESGSLRRFHLGRTDTIRSCSPESVAFCRSMSDPNCSTEERARLLRTAVSEHTSFVKELTSGSAFDRHLLGLRLLAASSPDANRRDEVNSLFNDPTYAVANHYRLSTSQIRSPHDIAVTFGAVVADGYGVCYNIHDKFIQVQTSAFRASPETRTSSELVGELAVSLGDMQRLLSGGQ